MSAVSYPHFGSKCVTCRRIRDHTKSDVISVLCSCHLYSTEFNCYIFDQTLDGLVEQEVQQSTAHRRSYWTYCTWIIWYAQNYWNLFRNHLHGFYSEIVCFCPNVDEHYAEIYVTLQIAIFTFNVMICLEMYFVMPWNLYGSVCTMVLIAYLRTCIHRIAIISMYESSE